MPNNPGSRRAGALLVPAANKVQRGQAVQRTVDSATALLADQAAAAAGGGGGGGGGGAGDVVGPAGAVNGNIAVYDGVTGKLIKDFGLTPDQLIGTGRNAAFGLLTANAVFTSKAVVYPGGGAIQLRFDLGNSAYIACGVGTLNLSPAGSVGLVAGRSQRIVVKNTSGAIVAVTLNAAWTVVGYKPAFLGIGQVIEFLFDITNTTEADVSVAIITHPSPPRGCIYPEDYGAIGDGVSNDYAALAAAVAATPPGSSLILTKNYAIGTKLSITCDVLADARSTLVPFGGLANGVSIDTGTGVEARKVILGSLNGFSGIACQLGPTTVVDLQIMKIDSCGTGVLLGGGTLLNCDIKVLFIGNTTQCFKVASAGGVIQGNRINCNFAVGCKYGLDYDGSVNCDSNTCIFGSWDSTTVGSARAFINSNSSGGGGTLANWRLWVTDWCGWNAAAAPAAKFCDGAFTACEFDMSNLFGNMGGLNDWGFIVSPAVNSQNSFKTSYKMAATPYPKGQWQIAAANRAAFLTSPQYMNTVYCTGTLPGGGVAAGALLTVYVYSPFTDGGYSNYKVIPSSGIGLVCVGVIDNSLVNPNEVVLIFVNATAGLLAAGTTFDFALVQGLP